VALTVECFTAHLAEIESAVVTHELDNSVELLVYEGRLICDNRYRNNGTSLIVLMVDFSD